MSTKTKLTTAQRESIKRAIYLLRVAAFTDLVNDEAIAPYDGTECDGLCFRDDSRDAFDHLEAVFGPFKMPKDTPVDENTEDYGWED